MRVARHTARFRRDYKKMSRSRGEKINKLRSVIDKLIDGELLDQKYHDHALHGEWRGCRDCHIEGDWILIYELGVNEEAQETITFHATDNHENLFG